ncbi:Drug/Metabolite transporter superfamily, partial [Micromonas commoda]
GVLVSLCIYGVLQERLMTIPYGGGSGDDSPPPEFFRSSIFLVLMNRLVTVSVSATGIFLTGERFSPKGTPLELYAMIAFGNLVTTVCQYEVLKYLSFAASTLAKCAKIIPVMCWGRLILNKRYSAADFVSAFVVTAGCFIFFVDSLLPRGQLHQLALGVVIMVVYLGFDGFTSTFQQMLYRRYSTSILNQIFFTTCFSSCMSTAWLLTTDQVPGVIQFIKVHPECVQDIFTLSVSSAVSQFAISYTIFCFGAVTLASVMTFRQFISVVISCFLFGSPLTLAQWFGVCLVL